MLSPDFKKLLSARFCYSFAVQMQSIMIGWQVYRLTHDPLALGMVGLVSAVPALSLALHGGWIVDRNHPLIVYRGVIAISLLSAVVMLLPQIFERAFDLQSHTAVLYVASFITGLARAFSQPAIYAITPRMIERKNLALASAWTSSTMEISRVAGPAVGGIVFGWWGMQTGTIAVCVFLLIALGNLTLIDFAKYGSPTRTRFQRIPARELFSGVSFVFRHPLLLPTLSLDMISVLFGGVTALLPIFADDILHIGADGLGILRAAPAIGATAMSYWMTRLNVKMNAGRWFLLAIAGFGVSILVFAASRNFYLSVFALGMSGVFDSINVIIRGATVQLASPANMRGQVSAVNSIFVGSSNEIGEFESGVAAKLLGTVPSVYFGGVMCLLTVGIIGFFSKPLRRLNLHELEASVPQAKEQS